MATYFTDDFADFGTDWTERYNTTPTWSVSSGDLTVPTGVTSDWCAVTWNDIDGDADRDDVEALILVTIPAASIYPIVLRASGADESASLYTLRLATTSLRTYYCNGADAPTQIGSVSASMTAGVDYWVRFRINGTSVQARFWADGGGEPGTWNIDSTDSTVSGAGWAGLSIYTNSGAGATIKQVGFGTNGDTAPDAAGGGNTISVPAGALVLAGFAPVVTATSNQTIAVPAGTLTLSAFAPTIGASAGNTIAVPAGALTLAAFAPVVTATANNSISVPAGSLTLAGFAPTVGVSSGAAIAVPAGALSLTAYAPDVSATTNYVSVPAGALTITGFAPTVSDGAASGFIKYFDVLSGRLLILRAL